MKKAILTVLLFFALGLIFSCYYDNEESLYPDYGNSCDTTNVTFSGNVIPLLQNSCWSCHANSVAASNGNNIRLEDYADISANSTRISGAINHNGGYSPMPRGAAKLDDCLIRQFDIWVADGKPQN